MSGCSLCHGAHDEFDPCPPIPREPASRAFAAKYAGWCKACAEPIDVGEQIVMSEADGGACHEGCES